MTAAYTLLASSPSSYHQKSCHPTIEMMIVPRRKIHLIKLLIFIPLATLLFTSIYYTFFYDFASVSGTSSVDTDQPLSDQQQVIATSLMHQQELLLQQQYQRQQQRQSIEFGSQTINFSNNHRIIQTGAAERHDASYGDNDNNDVFIEMRGNKQTADSGKPHIKFPLDEYFGRRFKSRQKQSGTFDDSSFLRHDDSALSVVKDEPLSASSVLSVNDVADNNGNGETLLLDSATTSPSSPTSSLKQTLHGGKRYRNKNRVSFNSNNNEDDRQANAQSVAVIPPPNETVGLGEMGRPVVLKNLTKDQQNLVNVGWENNAFNQYISDLISLNRTLPDVRDSSCKNVLYSPDEIKSLPPTSIIICFHNEAWSVLLRTVHSALNRSPKGLIKEIILVDDFSSKAHLKQQLEDYVKPLEIVKVIRAKKREGLIRARLLGAAHATAPVLTFLDSHCECADGWLEPLLARIKQDSHAVVCPVIDVISDKTFEYHYKNSADSISVGGFDWNLQFNWHNVPDHERKRRKNAHDPIRSPTMAGGLFSIDKAFFERLGTYDSGFDIWGGENLELSFKTWMCGGTLEIMPCSHVGHVFRSRSPYKWRTGVNVLKRNSVRLAEVWMDDYKKYYYDRIGHELGDYGDISDRVELRRKLKCKSFAYFVEQVYPELFIPGEAVAYGDIRNEAGDKIKMCLDSPARKVDFHKPLGVYPCHGSGGNQYWLLSKDGEIRRDEACVDYAGHDVVLFPCHGSGGNQMWFYDNETKLIRHSTSGRCLELSADKVRVQMSDCDASLDVQRWRFQHYNSTLAGRPEFNL